MKNFLSKLINNSKCMLPEKDIIFLSIVFFIAICNITFYANSIVSGILIVSQICILFFFFFKRDEVSYFKYYLAFTAISLESDVLIKESNFYSLITTQVFDISIYAILLIPLIILLKKNLFQVFSPSNKYKTVRKVVALLLLCYIIAIVVGFVNILLNDNQVQMIVNYKHIYLSMIYGYGCALVTIFVIIGLIEKNSDEICNIKSVVIDILVILSFVTIYALIFEIRGVYDIYSYIIVPFATFFIPFLIILGIYQKEKYKKWSFILVGLISSIILLLNSASGKMLLIFACIPFIFISKYSKKNKSLSLLFIIAVIAILVILCRFISPNSGFGSKLHQLVAMLSIWDKDWLIKMPASPQCRIIELIDISIEYIKSPLKAILGKGYFGTFKEYTGLLHKIAFAFTDEEWKTGLFYGAHESLIKLYLSNGLLGVFVFFKILFTGIKNIKKSPWLISGIVWFIFFYGYSLSMLCIGAAMFVVGLMEIDYDK